MLIFSLRESKKIIFGTPVVSIFSIASLTIGILLIALSLLLNQKQKELNNFLNESVFVTAYLNPNLSAGKIDSIKKQIEKIKGTTKIIFTSADEAKRKFTKETGEDFSIFLEVNPLPASFQIWFEEKEGNFSRDLIEKNLNTIAKIKGIGEVQFDASFQLKILKWMQRIEKYVYLGTAIILMLACYIVYVTQKLGVQNRRSEIETMKLVGSKKIQIKAPFYFTSLFFSTAAFVAAIMAILIFYFLLSKLSLNIEILFVRQRLIFILISTILLSNIATWLSLRKI